MFTLSTTTLAHLFGCFDIHFFTHTPAPTLALARILKFER
jgi:hypothetical protein